MKAGSSPGHKVSAQAQRAAGVQGKAPGTANASLPIPTERRRKLLPRPMSLPKPTTIFDCLN